MVGNVVGSIFNLLFVLGVSSALRPIPVPGGGQLDLLCLAALSLLLLAVSLTGNRVILRSEALLLLASYAGYTGWRPHGLSRAARPGAAHEQIGHAARSWPRAGQCSRPK